MSLEKYLKLYPANLNILFGLAGIQYKMNKLDEALEALEKILVLDPVHKDARDFKTRLSLQMSSAVKKKHPELV